MANGKSNDQNPGMDKLPESQRMRREAEGDVPGKPADEQPAAPPPWNRSGAGQMDQQPDERDLVELQRLRDENAKLKAGQPAPSSGGDKSGSGSSGAA